MAAMAFVELVPGEWVQTLYSLIGTNEENDVHI
jgi:hypothetical protein